MVMVDLHCHLLPGIDDGSKNMGISLQLAREAVENGITHALLTPHHMNGRFVNHKQDVIQLTDQFRQQLASHNIPLTVFPGQEVRINGGLIEALDKDDILFADEGNRYLMLEFPDDDVPHYASQMIFELQQRGITPVIVHPERNTKIIAHPELLYELLQKGCLSQITASSYVGTFGKKVANFSQRLIANGQGYVFASDAHDLPGRKYEMRQAFGKMSQEFGRSLAEQYADNARSIINGEDVLSNDIRPLKKKKKFWLF
ncbi:tyrosine-phosphatase protein [Limosilactobacillus frumenti DSM 13145]|uniref:Tyrosine-protein phosphatase n=1 Tax=Limosilactobacillus frumenti DSM 13145 TaxID=1423746 RepID=A0A0R1P3N8_9LACO|nr:CpsB/CapC family capsule biosynthesis tyrosine phosphatase [Limosilactobacillus frumenti]KRL27198.1 tyrosine-phosphatase protein [Limosilactobacillus frumenti DSM 13145]QFG72657.1 tyrosine protein phosphatase [Limosilactobacillus frumenti]